jgi:hypothetical protein
LSPDVSQVFLPLRLRKKKAVSQLEQEMGKTVEPTETSLVYEPCLLALGSVSFVDRKCKVDETEDVGLVIGPEDLGAVVSWEDADPVELDVNELEDETERNALFGPIPPKLSTASKLKALSKDFANYLYDEERLNLQHNPKLKLYSEPGESGKEFKIRAQQVARERRDAEVDKLRDKYQKKLDRLGTRLSREEQELAEDRDEYEGRKSEELLSAGETLVGMLGIFGRRTSRGLSTAARKRRMTTKARADIVESEEEIERLEAEIEEMRLEMEEDAEAIAENWAEVAEEIETYAVKPRRSDVEVRLVALGWAPHWEIAHRSARGKLTHDRVPAWA